VVAVAYGLNLATVHTFVRKIPFFTLGGAALAAGPVFTGRHKFKTMGTFYGDPPENKKRTAGHEEKRAHELKLKT